MVDFLGVTCYGFWVLYFVYAIENTSNGMSYVGKTKNLMQRWTSHLYTGIIGEVIAKEGLHNFTFRVLDVVDSHEEAIGKERLYTHLLESNIPEFGYNHPDLYSWYSVERDIKKADWRGNQAEKFRALKPSLI